MQKWLTDLEDFRDDALRIRQLSLFKRRTVDRWSVYGG